LSFECFPLAIVHGERATASIYMIAPAQIACAYRPAEFFDEDAALSAAVAWCLLEYAQP
jgi:hypothetical protein